MVNANRLFTNGTRRGLIPILPLVLLVAVVASVISAIVAIRGLHQNRALKLSLQPKSLPIATDSSRTDAEVYGKVSIDLNHNGLSDLNEPGYRDVKVVLTGDNELLQTLTDGNGYFTFWDVQPGKQYQVQVIVPAGFTPTSGTQLPYVPIRRASTTLDFTLGCAGIRHCPGPNSPTISLKAWYYQAGSSDKNNGRKIDRVLNVPYGSNFYLYWIGSANDLRCQASGGWTGPKLAYEEEERGPITARTTYQITCTTPAGVAVDNMVVEPLATPVP